MMDLDEAIQHCKEQVQEQAKKGCYSCAEEHQQLAEWLKDYKRLLGESRSENPNTCGDAISREELIEALDTWDKFGYAPTNELIPLRDNVDKDKYAPYIHYDDVIECIKGMPSVTKQPCDDAISRKAVLDLAEWFDLNQQHFIVANLIDEVENMPAVTPQQRTGEWIERSDIIGKWYECDQCHTDWGGPVNFCPNCGCKMQEVEE